MQEGTVSCCNSLPQLWHLHWLPGLAKRCSLRGLQQLSDGHISLLSSSPSFPCNTNPISTGGIA